MKPKPYNKEFEKTINKYIDYADKRKWNTLAGYLEDTKEHVKQFHQSRKEMLIKETKKLKDRLENKLNGDGLTVKEKIKEQIQDIEEILKLVEDIM